MYLQRQTTSLRPLTTAHLAQTMSLLELPTTALRQKIDAELARNPALELLEEHRCPGCQRLLPRRAKGPAMCPVCTNPRRASPDQPIVFLAPPQEFTERYPASSHAGAASGSDLPDDQLAGATETLPQYVLRQVATELQIDDRPLAAHILTSLNEDGLLAIPLAEIALYHHVPLARIEKVLRIIQMADPLGVGSPTPQAALLVQIEALNETHSAPPLAVQAVTQGMDLLSHRRYLELGRLLKISTAEAHRLADFISDNLNPFPARAHWGEAGRSLPHNDHPTAYQTPDIIISRLNDLPETPLVVEIAVPYYGTLRINPLFQQAIQQAPAEKAELWQTDLDQAALLVKCIQQRNHTIVRLSQRLAVLQRDFILYGEAHLQPITRARLALELGVHESTVSRAVASKGVQMPNRRILPMATFFDRSLHIRTALKQIIDQETSPLSDLELAGLLSRQGFDVARRTVSKYRSMEGILPAHLRSAARPMPAP